MKKTSPGPNHLKKQMKKNDLDEYFCGSHYRILSVEPDIDLCFVRISAWEKAYLGANPDPGSFEPVCIRKKNFETEWLDDSELETVNRFAARKRQIEWMCGRYAVKKIAAARFRCREKDITVIKNDKGAPFFPDCFPCNLSISHSHEIAVAGVSPVEIRVGLDLERMDSVEKDLVLKVGFSEKERERLLNRPVEETLKNWTIKEAWLKYIGKGLNENLQETEIMDGAVFYRNKKIEGLGIRTQTICNRYVFTLLHSMDSDKYLKQ